jgi:chitin biosynthesis protein CHS5
MNTPPFTRPQSMSQVSLASPTRTNSAGGGVPKGAGNRSSMPPMARGSSSVSAPMSPLSPESQARALEAPREEPEEHGASGTQGQLMPGTDGEDDKNARPRKGTMNKDFKFPPTSSTPTPPPPPVPPVPTQPISQEEPSAELPKAHVIAPSSIEVPPPPPIEKERSMRDSEDADEDVGATVEIPL